MDKTTTKNPCKVTTRPGRLSFCYIYSPAPTSNLPNSKPDQADKYSTHLLIPKGDEKALQIIMQGIQAAVKDAVANYKQWGGKQPKKLLYPIHDGDEVADTKGEIYKGHYYLNASNYTRPPIYDRDRDDLDEENEVYSGAYARLSVLFKPYSNINKGITCRLLAVQKWEDGEPLSNSIGTADDFADADDEGFDDDGDLPFPMPGETDEEARAAEQAARASKLAPQKKSSPVDDMLNSLNIGGKGDYAA